MQTSHTGSQIQYSVTIVPQSKLLVSPVIILHIINMIWPLKLRPSGAVQICLLLLLLLYEGLSPKTTKS